MKLKLLALAGVAMSLAACETTTSYPYQPSTQNVMAFQSALKPSNTKVQLGAFRRWMRDSYEREKLPAYLDDQVRQGKLAANDANDVLSALADHAARRLK